MGFWDNWFGRKNPAQSGGSITVTSNSGSGGSSLGAGRFATTLEKNNATMLRQLDEARRYEALIREAAGTCGLPVAVVCGIGSRESHWGLALKPPGPGGTGDFSQRNPRGNRQGRVPPDGGGYGRGLMQIDYDWHEFARTGSWQDPRSNLRYSADELLKSRQFFEQRQIPANLLLTAIIASYNAGRTATLNCYQSGQDIDCNTTGRDYSRDVLNRAGWFQLHGWT